MLLLYPLLLSYRC